MLGAEGFVLDGRREAAHKQMLEACQGPYVITREWDEDEEEVTLDDSTGNVSGSGTSSTSGSGSAAAAGKQHRNVEFQCEGPPKAE